MLQITKQGNSIVVKGLDHALYPYSGTLEIPCNSVITVVDESDIVTFRSASNYDVLFSGLVSELTINGESVTKENVGDKFGAIANTKYGLTPEQEDKLNNAVQIADYNADKEAQATIDEAQTSEINKLKTKYSDLKIDFNQENCIEIVSYTESHRVKTIRFGNTEIAGTEARSLLGLKSTNFSFEINGDVIKFKVLGYGHGVGMSQTGADSMAKGGSSAEEIIKHFYSGVEIKTVNEL